jgi:hypothetical protein
VDDLAGRAFVHERRAQTVERGRQQLTIAAHGVECAWLPAAGAASAHGRRHIVDAAFAEERASTLAAHAARREEQIERGAA